MSDPPPNPLALPDDWSWQLGQKFLVAAQACGFTCERAFQADPAWTIALCCDPCQLHVLVFEELAKWPRAACGFRVAARVTLYLDICQPDSELDPAELNTMSADGASARTMILQGIMATLAGQADGFDFASSLVDPLALNDKNVSGGIWRTDLADATCVRWAITFTVEL